MAELTDVATWSRLQAFLAAYDAGGIAAAAAALQVTSPAVSAAVAALEKGLGVALFARSGRGIVATAAGDTFAEYARSLLGLLDQAKLAVASPETGLLRLGAVETAAEYVLPGLMASFLAAHPGVELSVEVLSRDRLFAAAARHEVDVVLAGRPPSGLRSRAWRPNRLLVVAAPEGDRGRWLLRSEGSGTREASLALLGRLELHPPVLTLGGAGAALAAARRGLGVTLAHEDAVRADLAAGILVRVPVPGTPLDRPWHVSLPLEVTPTSRLFLAHVTDPALVGEEAFRPEDHPRG